MTSPNVVQGDSVGPILSRALEAGGGLLRLTPTWVPRSFLHPGRRIKLHPADLYAYGGERGGIDERWFSSTTEAANEGRVWHEGLSFASFEGQQFTLRDAVTESGATLIGSPMFQKYGRWPVYSKFFDNMGPIPPHMHQGFKDAKLTGQEGKPENRVGSLCQREILPSTTARRAPVAPGTFPGSPRTVRSARRANAIASFDWIHVSPGTSTERPSGSSRSRSQSKQLSNEPIRGVSND